MVGSGTVSVTAGSTVLSLSAAQAFKEGATVIVDYAGTPQYFTVDSGATTTWVAMQDAASTASNKNFKTSDTGTGRNRGTDGVIVPNAAHFMYRAIKDGSGADDWYFYFDTLFPEKGLHPYTKDQFTGSTVPAAKAVQAVIPDALTRLRILEGIARGGGGDTLNPDKRLDDIITRLVALETWANGPGHFGTPPAVGSSATYTVAQLLDLGDAL
ncbi:MAG TPA: hypothetical protein VFV05_24745 [Methylomirabilota bacterium]|nr:hypothetical protein [Methylomirabilota bacterium]